jgi:cadherin EGF LAG seven-pass G-type receptor 1
MSIRRRPWLAVLLLTILADCAVSYLLLVRDSLPAGEVIFDSSVYKLGSERHYTINVHRTANFVHHIFKVDPKNGSIALRKRLRCDGILYPNLFTLYVDSTSNRIRDIDYYSLPLRVLITGPNCGNDDSFENNAHPDDLEHDSEEFDNEHLDDEVISDYEESEDYYQREKRDIRSSNPLNEIDVRLWEDEEFDFRRRKRDLSDGEGRYAFDMAHVHKSRRRRNYPFDMTVHTKLSMAKQWISETYASFAIPTTDKWNQICLKESQYINSLSAFLPKTIQQYCKVTFVDVDDLRFKIESSQGDLVASDDLCIQEPMWKVTVLFNYKCDNRNIVDMDHRLKIVYHHQVFNDTDIAKRVRRELRNQSPFFEQALYVASVAEEQEPGALVTTVRAR